MIQILLARKARSLPIFKQRIAKETINKSWNNGLAEHAAVAPGALPRACGSLKQDFFVRSVGY
jgi:hypothetical protein